jgi:hypothetical protein
LFGFLPIIALVLGYQEEFMSQAKADGGIKNVLLVHRGFVNGSGWQYAVTGHGPHLADVGRVCQPEVCDYSCS